MGDIGISQWSKLMNYHKSRGDRIIAYSDGIDKKAEIEKGLFLKEQRIYFWKRNHKVPTLSELDLRVYEVEA